METTDNISMPSEDYITYLSQAIAGTKIKLQTLMTDAYYLAWGKDFVNFWKQLTLIPGKGIFPIADRKHSLEGCSEKCADKIVLICREADKENKSGQNYRILQSGKAFLNAMEEKEAGKQKEFEDLLTGLGNDIFGKCIEERYRQATEEEKKRCMRNLDLAGCFKINTVSTVQAETYRRLGKIFRLCDIKSWKALNQKAIRVRNFCVGHDTSTTLEETEPSQWREIRHSWEEIAKYLACKKTQLQYDKFCEEVLRGARKLCYSKVLWKTLADEAGLSEAACKEILNEIYHYESDTEGVFCESKEEALASLSERQEWEGVKEENKALLARIAELEKRFPEMDEKALEQRAEESILEEKLKRLPRLDKLAGYQGGIMGREQLRELMGTHLMVLDSSVLLNPAGREFIEKELVPYAVQGRGGKEQPPFVVAAQTRYEIYQKYRQGDRTAYYFMEDILRKKLGIVRYQGIPNPLYTNEEAMEDFTAANSLQRMCILTYGPTELPKQIDHESYPLCLVGRISKMPLKGAKAEMRLFSSSLPIEAGKGEGGLRERLLESFRLAESRKDEAYFQKTRKKGEELSGQPEPKQKTMPEETPGSGPETAPKEEAGRKGELPSGALSNRRGLPQPTSEGQRGKVPWTFYTEKGKKVVCFRVLQENGQDARGGEGTLYETDQTGKVAKIFHEDRRTDSRQEKITYMVENPVKIPKVCWPEAVLYDEAHVFVGFLMRQVPKGCMQLGTSVLQLLKPTVQEKLLGGWNRLDLVRTARSIAGVLAKLHQRDILMGDINAGNFLVDPKNSSSVYLVDCDSYQVKDYPCPVGKEEYTHPTMADRLGMRGRLEFGNCLRIREEEEYSLAILIFQILMLGEFPFTSKSSKSLAQSMREREFPYSREEASNIPDGPNWMIWKNLPRNITDAFGETFRNWKTISAEEWEKRLKSYEWMIQNRGFSDRLTPKKYHEFHPEKPFYEDVTCAVCKEEFNMPKEKAEKYRAQGRMFFCSECFGFIQTLNNTRGEETFRCERCGKSYKALAQYGYLNEVAGVKLICQGCKRKRRR